MSLVFRLITYGISWVAYLSFMASYAPLGNSWLHWHFQRIYNASEYLKLNGYFSSYGFTIWSSCENCVLNAADWVGNIYLSITSVTLSPYLMLNHFWGEEALELYGPLVDKLVIFIAAAAAAELIIKCVKNYSKLPVYFIGVSSFVLFSTSPWVYKVLVATWDEIYFLMFVLLGFLCFANQRNVLACLLFVAAGLFNYQWGMAVALFYTLIFFASLVTKEPVALKNYFPPSILESTHKLFMICSLLVGTLLTLTLRLLAAEGLDGSDGTPLLSRVGITGDDIHNGGLLGALQFLGGNRITVCFGDYGSGILSLNSANFLDSIAIYNCSLSIGGMAILSLLAIVGMLILLKKSEPSQWLVLPILFALLVFVTTLQQSLSVHLMGYSYIFSFIFAVGITGLMLYFSQLIKSSALGLVFLVPCLIGIVILSIRVSMLTGVNG
ncbi:MAG: hypothetical protein CMD78_05400 [Gammaproteobacteria bacterium]|nr:hypothetical protein [Gammaproteobacteria bacterium]|tara:strand:+ start:1777 stop:3093 length:1317 start_codon:yes stop_codon:yes gene_type:complete